ncbi:MAG: hypothetical protein Q4A90_00855 [Streptococcus sp.]|nr:hypothetical protein [Streptococcus sp.]
MKEKIKEKEALVVKTNIIVFFVPIILFFPFLFISLMMIVVAFEYPLVLIAPLPMALMLTCLGFLNLLNLFQFGLKKMIIGSEHLIYFQWKIKKTSWGDIKDIQLKKFFREEFIRFILKNGKSIDIPLKSLQLNISSDYIYETAVKKWQNFIENKNTKE